ncbi:MAG: beta-ketoacyl-ACP synthase II [Deltaproteobacteria bacterium]|nr:MAG: beta-ketoacyl-ACP synthase II [Deltaproteobacteria bacterium]
MAEDGNRRRVVATGLGLVTPLGNNVQLTWQSMLKGKSGISTIRKWGDLDEIRNQYNLPQGFPSIAGEVKDFDISEILRERKANHTRDDTKRLKQTDPFIAHACAASLEAVKDSGLSLPFPDKDRVGVAIGSGQGGIQTLEEQHRRMLAGKKLSPFFIPRHLANLASGNVSILLGAHGMNLCPSTACATGAHAVLQAFRAVQLGYNDIVIVGGTEAAITPLNVYGFHALNALSTAKVPPDKASRPFDRYRDGFVMAEGAGVMILESLARAQKRSAKIYAELIGCGEAADAYHITEPNVDGTISCMRLALKDAGITPKEVDLVNPHATSTPKGDASEARAIMAVFGQNQTPPLVTANKSQIGHALGAAGAIEAAITVLSVSNDKVPPISNLEHPDEDCKGLNFVRGRAVSSPINVAISNSAGFGGTNVSLAFRKFKE